MTSAIKLVQHARSSCIVQYNGLSCALRHDPRLLPSTAKGVLLYPAVGETPPFEAVIQGHEIRVVTINLDQPWPNIRTNLLSLFGCPTETNTRH